MDRTEKLSIEQKIYRRNRKAIDRRTKTRNNDIFVAKTCNYDIFVAKTHNYDIFVAEIYDYALIDSFRGFLRLIDSPTSYSTLWLGNPVGSGDIQGGRWLRTLLRPVKCHYLSQYSFGKIWSHKNGAHIFSKSCLFSLH